MKLEGLKELVKEELKRALNESYKLKSWRICTSCRRSRWMSGPPGT
jgi:hypothetical protein